MQRTSRKTFKKSQSMSFYQNPFVEKRNFVVHPHPEIGLGISTIVLLSAKPDNIFIVS